MPKHSKKTMETGASARRWAENELETLRLGDERNDRRVKKVLGDFAAQPEASIPRASQDWGSTKGAYRFFTNEAVEASALLAAHRQASVTRAHGSAVVLAVQDTTTMNFSTHPKTKGLGPVGNNRDKTIGLLLHSTLLLQESGQALGVLDTQWITRDPAQFKAGPAGGRNRKPVEQKVAAQLGGDGARRRAVAGPHAAQHRGSGKRQLRLVLAPCAIAGGRGRERRLPHPGRSRRAGGTAGALPA
jgi:hypothetical protein